MCIFMDGLVDYHTHSVLSDGSGVYEEMVQVAIKKGLSEIGFSDHICLREADWAVSSIDLPVMTEQISEIKEKYKDYITIRYGIEMDYFLGEESRLEEIINSLPLDYVIGSVHFIGDWNFDTDKSLYGKWDNDELYRIYFELIQKAARSKLFDVIGHLDIIKKFRVYPESNQKNLFEQTIKVLKESDCVVELNTGGLDRPCNEFTPNAELIKMCFAHGVPVTLGSDAHAVSQIGRHFDIAVDLLKETGYTGIVAFNKRGRNNLKI